MDASKAYFVRRANLYGILYVRKRDWRDTGWGALEFLLNNGEIFVISGEQFGQGAGEEGLWVDMNGLRTETREEEMNKIKAKLQVFRQREMRKFPEHDSPYLTNAKRREMVKELREREQLTKAPEDKATSK